MCLLRHSLSDLLDFIGDNENIVVISVKSAGVVYRFVDDWPVSINFPLVFVCIADNKHHPVDH